MISLNKTITVREGIKVEIETSLFDVRVFKSDDETAKVEYEYNSRGNSSEAEELFSIEYNEEKNRLKISENDHPENLKISEGILRVALPDISELEIDNENGAVEILDQTGKIRIEGENGLIEIKGCSGSLTLENENGLVQIKSFEGKMSIKTENGGIDIFSGTGTLKAESENGQIRVIKSALHQVEINSENGSIFYHLPMLEKGNLQLSNTNGKINLIIPDELSFNLQAKNDNGRFHIGLKENYEMERDNGSRIVKMIRGVGKVEIKLENENGSIDLLDDKQGDFNFKFHRSGHGPGRGGMMPNMPDMQDFFANMESLMGDKINDKIRLKIRKKMQEKGWNMDNMGEQMRKKFEWIFQNNHSNDNDVKHSAPDRDKETSEDYNNYKSSRETAEKADFRELEEKVLKMVEKGTISAEEAEKLLNTIKEES